MQEFTMTVVSLAFCDVAWYRDGCSADLVGEAEFFSRGELFRRGVLLRLPGLPLHASRSSPSERPQIWSSVHLSRQPPRQESTVSCRSSKSGARPAGLQYTILQPRRLHCASANSS